MLEKFEVKYDENKYQIEITAMGKDIDSIKKEHNDDTKPIGSLVPVDLRTCESGDLLIMRNGGQLLYDKVMNDGFYSHHVKYVNEELGVGSRTDNGQIFYSSESKEDVVEIIHKKDFVKKRGTITAIKFKI